MRISRFSVVMIFLGLAVLASPHVFGGSHTWDVNELFSNADGSIQFIELKETGGGPGETFVGGHQVTSNTNTFTIPSNVAPPTSFRHLLLATAGFAALPGAPTPDHIIPTTNFFSVNGDRIDYVPWDFLIFGPGELPTDGVRSLGMGGVTAANSPTNYAGQTGSVDASTPPPAVPDGTAGSTPMDVVPLDIAASSLSISWDTATCTGASQHQIIHGERSNLPAGPGGAFGLTGAVCGMGATSPFTWNAVPSSSDGLLWWLIVVRDGSGREGSWGRDSAGAERRGPAADGSSAQCGVATRNLGNACGH